MRLLFGVFFLVVLLAGRPAAAATDAEIDAMCRPFFGSACSEALGNWLPRVPNSAMPNAGAPTTVRDEIVDPAGTGARGFLDQRGVYGGTLFVYGMAGPPKGHAVYDPAHRIAYYDEGCCSVHHVVVVAGVGPPPKSIVERSLAGLKTTHGIALGAEPSQVRAVYGPAVLQPVKGSRSEATAEYNRVIKHPTPYSDCAETTTFLFDRGRLTAMDFTDAC